MISICFQKFPVFILASTLLRGRKARVCFNPTFASRKLNKGCFTKLRGNKVLGSLASEGFCKAWKQSLEARLWVQTQPNGLHIQKPSLKGNRFKLHGRFYAVDSQAIFFNRPFDKSRLKKMIFWSLSYYGHKKTIDFIETLKNVGYMYSTKAGISIGIDDLTIPPSKKQLLNQTRNDIFSDYQDLQSGFFSELEYAARLLYAWNATNQYLRGDVITHFKQTDTLNPVFMMSFSGARGNIAQVRQLVGMRGLMTDLRGRVVNYAIQTNFREGLNLTEYVISCYGARKGVIDTALRTATAGYLTRRLVDIAQHVVIIQLDCDTHRGIYLNPIWDGDKIMVSLKTRLFGRTLAQSVWDPVSKKQIAAKNQVITAQLADLLVTNQIQVLIRSPLTCNLRKQVCSYCYGWDLSCNKLVHIGEAVGVIAAQSIGEPGTQLTMRTFHTGGVYSADVEEKLRCPFTAIASFAGAIPGKLVRTLTGDVGFLVKQVCSFILTPIDSRMPSKNYLLKPYTVVFAKHLQQINAFDLLFEAPPTPHESKKTRDMFETVYSNISGQLKIKAGSSITLDYDRTHLGSRHLQDVFLTSLTLHEFWIFALTAQIIYNQNLGLFIRKGDYIETKAHIAKYISLSHVLKQHQSAYYEIFNGFNTTCFKNTNYLNFDVLFRYPVQNKDLFKKWPHPPTSNKYFFISKPRPNTRFEVYPTVPIQQKAYETANFTSTSFENTRNTYFFQKWQSKNAYHGLTQKLQTSSNFNRTLRTFEKHSQHHSFSFMCDNNSTFDSILRVAAFAKKQSSCLGLRMCKPESSEYAQSEGQRRLKNKLVPINLNPTLLLLSKQKVKLTAIAFKNFSSRSKQKPSSFVLRPSDPTASAGKPEIPNMEQIKPAGFLKLNPITPIQYGFLNVNHIILDHLNVQIKLNHWFLTIPSFYLHYWRNTTFLQTYWKNSLYLLLTYHAMSRSRHEQPMWLNVASWTKKDVDQLLTYRGISTHATAWVARVNKGLPFSPIRESTVEQPAKYESKYKKVWDVSSPFVKKYRQKRRLNRRRSKSFWNSFWNIGGLNPWANFVDPLTHYYQQISKSKVPLRLGYKHAKPRLWNLWKTRLTQGFSDAYRKMEPKLDHKSLALLRRTRFSEGSKVSIFQFLYPSHTNCTKLNNYNIKLPLDCKASRNFYIKSVKPLVKTKKILLKQNPTAFVLTQQSQINSVFTSKKTYKSLLIQPYLPGLSKISNFVINVKKRQSPKKQNQDKRSGEVVLKTVILRHDQKRQHPIKQVQHQDVTALRATSTVAASNISQDQTQVKKRGRPKKQVQAEEAQSQVQTQAKKRGRPRKQVQDEEAQSQVQTQTKKRGRPRKQVQDEEAQSQVQTQVKKRGRPRKQVQHQDVTNLQSWSQPLNQTHKQRPLVSVQTQKKLKNKRFQIRLKQYSDQYSNYDQFQISPAFSFGSLVSQTSSKKTATIRPKNQVKKRQSALDVKPFFFNPGFLLTQYQSNMLLNYHVFNHNVNLIFLWFFVLKKVSGFFSQVTDVSNKPSNLLEQTLKHIQPCTSFVVCDGLKPHMAITSLVNKTPEQSTDCSNLSVVLGPTLFASEQKPKVNLRRQQDSKDEHEGSKAFFSFLYEKQKANFSCLTLYSPSNFYLSQCKQRPLVGQINYDLSIKLQNFEFDNKVKSKGHRGQSNSLNYTDQKDQNKKLVNLSNHKLKEKIKFKCSSLPVTHFLPDTLSHFLKPSIVNKQYWIQDFLFKSRLTLFPPAVPKMRYERFEELFLCFSKEKKFSVFYNPLKNKITRRKPFNNAFRNSVLTSISCDKYVLPKPSYAQPYIKAGMCNDFSNPNRASRFVTDQISKYYLIKLKKLVGMKHNEKTISPHFLMLPVWQMFTLNFTTKEKMKAKQILHMCFAPSEQNLGYKPSEKVNAPNQQSSTQNTQMGISTPLVLLLRRALSEPLRSKSSSYFHLSRREASGQTQQDKIDQKYSVFLRYKEKNWFETMFQTQWHYTLDFKCQDKNASLSLKPLLLKQNKHFAHVQSSGYKKFRNRFSDRYFSLSDCFYPFVNNSYKSIKQLNNKSNKHKRKNKPTTHKIQLNSFCDYYIKKAIPKKFQEKMQDYFLLKKDLVNRVSLVDSNSLHRFTGFDQDLNFEQNWISLFTKLNQSLHSNQRLVVPAYGFNLNVGFDQPVCLNRFFFQLKVPQILNSYDWWILTPFDHVENGVCLASNSKANKSGSTHWNFASLNQTYGLELLNKPHFHPIFCRSLIQTLYQTNLDSLFFDTTNIIITEEFRINQKAQHYFNSYCSIIFKKLANFDSIRTVAAFGQKQTKDQNSIKQTIKNIKQNKVKNKKLDHKQVLLIFLHFYYQKISLVPLLSVGRHKLKQPSKSKNKPFGKQQTPKFNFPIHLTWLENNKTQSCFKRCFNCFGFKVTSKPKVRSKKNTNKTPAKSHVIQSYVRLILFQTMKLPLKIIDGSLHHTMQSLGQITKNCFFMHKYFYRFCSVKKSNNHQPQLGYRMFLMHTANMYINLDTRYQPKLLISGLNPAFETAEIQPTKQKSFASYLLPLQGKTQKRRNTAGRSRCTTTKKHKLESINDDKQGFNQGFKVRYSPVALLIWQKSQQMVFSDSKFGTNPGLNPMFKLTGPKGGSLNQTFRQHIFQKTYLNNTTIINHQIAHQKLLQGVRVADFSETQHKTKAQWNQTPSKNLLIDNCALNLQTTNKIIQSTNTVLSQKQNKSRQNVTPIRLELKKQRLSKSYMSMSESDCVDANFVDELTIFTAFIYSTLGDAKTNRNKKIQSFTLPKQWLKMNIKHKSLKLPHILSCLDHYYDLYIKLDFMKRGSRFFVYTAIRNHPVSQNAALDLVNNQKSVIPFLFPYRSKGLLFCKQNYFVHRGFPYLFTLHLDYNHRHNWIKQQCYLIADKPSLVLLKTSQLFKRHYLHKRIRKVSTTYMEFNKKMSLNKPLRTIKQKMIKKILSHSTGEVVGIKQKNIIESKILKAYHETNEFLAVHYYSINDLVTYEINSKASAKLKLGQICSSHQYLTPGIQIAQSGQLVFLTEQSITLRKIQMNLITKSGLFSLKNNMFIKLHTPLAILNYKSQIEEDFLQGIAKLEQLFEARRNLVTGFSVKSVVFSSFLSFLRGGYNIKFAVRYSMHFIQQYLVNGIQIVYENQGINIADKHLEVIVKQMTSKVKIVKSGNTGLLVGDIVYLDSIERANTEVQMISSQSIAADYRPIVLGLTKASLTTEGFLSAASFQETIRVLSKAALFNKRDFLGGLKENVICGNVIPAGTGLDYLSVSINLKKKSVINYHQTLKKIKTLRP